MANDERRGLSHEAAVRLMEQQIVEGSLTPHELARLSEHRHDCQECASLAVAVEVMSESGDELADAERQRLEARIIEGVRARRRGRRGMIWLGGVVAAAAVLLLALALWRFVLTPPMGGPKIELVAGSLCSARGKVVKLEARRSLRACASDTRLRIGNALVGFEENSRFRVDEASRARLAMHLEGGAAALRVSRGPNERDVLGEVRVSTPSCVTHVTGTTFLVEVREHDTQVDVLAGEVRVETPAPDSPMSKAPRQRVALRAGWSLRVNRGEKTALGPARKAKAQALLEGAKLPGDGGVRSPPDSVGHSSPDAAAPRPDVAVKKQAPVRKVKRPGKKVVVQPTPPPAAAPTAGELLSRARSCRAKRDWACAAAAYRQLVQKHPSFGASKVSLVSLAEIELVQLKEPGAALGHFDRYLALAPSGVLAEEALFGRARALRVLGRRSAERAAISRYLRRYPSGVHAKALEKRLGLLGK